MSIKTVLVLLLITAAICTQDSQEAGPATPPEEGAPVEYDGNVYTPDEEIVEIHDRIETLPEEPVETLSQPKIEEAAGAPVAAPAPQNYLYESMLVSLVFMFLINYKSGKRSNEVIADRWVRSVMNIIRDNFALVGFGDTPNQEDQAVILEESAHEYTFYASGRDNLHFLEASFEVHLY